MKKPSRLSLFLMSDVGVLVLLGLARVLMHTLTNGQYGFHRDELETLNNARNLAWGYVAYPPVTPFVARLSLELFGPSLPGFRFFSAVAQAVAMVLTGLMAREFGGRRPAQLLAALAVAAAPVSVIESAMLQYVSFDYLWWVLIAYLIVRLLKSREPRWWLAIGTAIGVGMMTKYTMAFYLAGIAGGVILTRARRYLISPWLWGGVALSLLIFLPNLVWQMQHGFVSLEFLSYIHARDIRIGRTEGFLAGQLIVGASPFLLPLWLAGLHYLLLSRDGREYRLLGWTYLITLALLFLSQGRSYYLAPAYPMLFAAGAVRWESWVASLSTRASRAVAGVSWGLVGAGLALGIVIGMPVAPVNSDLWKFTRETHDDFAEQIGWPELAETVAGIYNTLPPEERPGTGILAGNYGEAGAVNLYGPSLGLPPAISGVNSYWEKGYGDPPPSRVIVLGFNQPEELFEGCRKVGRITNSYGVPNEETKYVPDIFLCGQPLQPWPDLWKRIRSFG